MRREGQLVLLPVALVAAVWIVPFASADRRDAARETALALIQELGSFTALVEALAADGAEGIRADLTGLRILQLAGHEEIARDLARELKRRLLGDAEVVDSIRRWNLLDPRIATVTPEIEPGQAVTVRGTVENPDIIDIRKVRVRIEVLDAGGNAFDAAEARVWPRILGPGETEEFDVYFRSVNPAAVASTRTTIIEWESEIPGGGKGP